MKGRDIMNSGKKLMLIEMGRLSCCECGCTRMVRERSSKMQQQMFGTVALPYSSVVDEEGNSRATFPGLTRNAAEFITVLKKTGTVE
jgi:hypothetical protein